MLHPYIFTTNYKKQLICVASLFVLLVDFREHGPSFLVFFLVFHLRAKGAVDELINEDVNVKVMNFPILQVPL